MNRAYRILYLINNLGPGGAQRQLMELVAHLPRQRVEPLICVYDNSLDFYRHIPRYEHLPVVELPKTSTLDARVVMHLTRVIREHRIDVVHACLLTAGAWGLAAALAEPSVRVICSERSDASAGPASWHVLRWVTFPRADLVIANSMRSAEHIRSRFRLPLGHVRWVPNGLDATYWSEPVEPSSRIERLFDALEPGRCRLGVVGTFCAWKDHATVVKALARVPADQRPSVVMAGRAADERITAELDALIAALGLERSVIRTDALEDVRGLYQAVDALVLTSRFEGFPNVALEALASGKPVISTAVSDLPQWIQPGRHGWLFQIGDAEGLAALLRDVVAGGPRRLEAMRAPAMELARSFTVERTVADTLQCYDALLG